MLETAVTRAIWKLVWVESDQILISEFAGASTWNFVPEPVIVLLDTFDKSGGLIYILLNNDLIDNPLCIASFIKEVYDGYVFNCALIVLL